MLKRILHLAAILAVITHVGCAGAQYVVPVGAAVGAIANGVAYTGGYSAGAVVVPALVIGVFMAQGMRDYRRDPDGMRSPYFGAPPPDPTRRISVQDCTKPVDLTAGNLMCR